MLYYCLVKIVLRFCECFMFLCIFPLGGKMVVVLIHTGLDVLFMPLENAWELLAIWPTLQVYYFCDCWAYLSFVSFHRYCSLLDWSWFQTWFLGRCATYWLRCTTYWLCDYQKS
jgi:hypothetical protein